MPLRFVLMLSAAALLAGCSTMGGMPGERLGSAQLVHPDGQPAGTAQIVALGNQVTLTVGLVGVPAGEHGIHLHTTGACRAPDFASAGGHLNPLGRKHGSLSADGAHAGDLPNITVRAGGSGTLVADLSGTPAEVRQWLFDADGSAVVVHADADDYRSDPSGNSGARVACGVFQP